MKNKKQIQTLIAAGFSVFLVVSLFALGCFFGIQSWNKQLYVQVHPSYARDLAEYDEEPLLYSVPLDEINEPMENKLFKNTKIAEKNNLLAFYLGHFLIPHTNKRGHQFVCQAYSHLEATFVALETSLNGEEGFMVVRAPCLMDEEEFIGPIWLPIQDMKKNVGQRSFVLNKQESLIRFYNISFNLNKKWLLKSIRFFNSPEDEGLIVNYKPGSKFYFRLDFSGPYPENN